MCRLASLFLLQRLKGSMSSYARDFNNIKTRAVIKFFSCKEIHAILTETFGEHAPSYTTVKNWVAPFKRGDFSTCDATRPGRPKTVTTPEIIDKIHELILEDGRISAKSIAEQLGISHERVGSIILEDLDMRMLSAKWVPKCPNADQKVNGATRLSNLWNFFGAIQMISCRARLVTMDVTWLCHYDPKTKQKSMEWRHSGSPRPQKLRVQKSAGNVPSLFLGTKTASSSLMNFQRAKLSTRSITHLCWCK